MVLSRFVVKLPADFDKEVVVGTLMNVPGIQNFSFYYHKKCKYETLLKDIVKNIPKEEILAMGAKTFRVRLKKSQGEFEKTTPEMEREIGAELLKADIGLGVSMTDPDLPVYVEALNGEFYYCFGRYNGIAGLPSGTGGKVLSLISSGFDSPIASYMMMRRGAKVSFVHFSGKPFGDRVEEEGVKELVKILSKYQGESKLTVIPFGDIQKSLSINSKIPASYRVVMYRRLMLKIAEKVATRDNAKALITGESFGQVASQTLANMSVIDGATHLPVFRPCIGLDKNEIIDMSRVIGTEEISKKPCSDTCALFMPRSPELSAKRSVVEEIEAGLDLKEIIEGALNGKEIIKIR